MHQHDADTAANRSRLLLVLDACAELLTVAGGLCHGNLIDQMLHDVNRLPREHNQRDYEQSSQRSGGSNCRISGA